VTIKPRDSGEIAIEWSHVHPNSGVTSATVKRDSNGRALPLIVYDNAYAAVSNMATVVAASPHIAIIIDKAVPLHPGAELMTIALGPQGDNDKDNDNTYSKEGMASIGTGTTKAPVIPDGCPISIETDNHVKFLTQIQKADVIVHINEFVDYALAHFNDVDALTDYLNQIFAKVSQAAGVGTGTGALAGYASVEVTKKHMTLAKVS